MKTRPLAIIAVLLFACAALGCPPPEARPPIHAAR